MEGNTWQRLTQWHTDVIAQAHGTSKTNNWPSLVKHMIYFDGIQIKTENIVCVGCPASCVHCQRLLWLTIWRSVFELVDSPSKDTIADLLRDTTFFVELRKFINCKEDPWLVHAAQKVYISALKLAPFQYAGIELCEYLLSSCTDMHVINVTPYLEICRQLLSRKNRNSHDFLKSAEPFLSHVCKGLWDSSTIHQLRNLQQHPSHDASCDQSCDSLLRFLVVLDALMSVFIKVVKLYNSESVTLAGRMMLNILYYSDSLLNLMFEPGTSDLVDLLGRKILHFYSVALHFDFIVIEKSGLIDYLTLAKSIFKKLKEKTLDRYPIRYGTISFTGMQKLLKEVQPCLHDSRGITPSIADPAQFRELSLLSLKLCFTMLKLDNTEGCICGDIIQYLYHLDNFLVSKLNEEMTSDRADTFDWLPHLLGDQDDAWIEAMLFLLEIKLQLDKRAKVEDVPLYSSHFIQPHRHFFQFLTATTFDHSILVDLLTSPETNFLYYFSRYLKFVAFDWEFFCKCLSSLSEKNSTSFKKDMRLEDVDIDKNVTDVLSTAENFSTKESLPHIDRMDISAFIERDTRLESHHKQSGLVFKRSLKIDIKEPVLVSEDDSRTICDQEIDKLCPVQSENEGAKCTLLLSSTEAKGHGLSFLMDNYTDDDDDDDDDDIQSENRSKGDNPGIAETYLENMGLDEVMSVLIRVRMKVERLYNIGMFPYNPKTLLSYLSRVEELYESE